MSDFEVIENSDRARDEFGHCYGSELYKVTEKQLAGLLAGKCLATTINGGEYSIFITLNEEEN